MQKDIFITWKNTVKIVLSALKRYLRQSRKDFVINNFILLDGKFLSILKAFIKLK